LFPLKGPLATAMYYKQRPKRAMTLRMMMISVDCDEDLLKTSGDISKLFAFRKMFHTSYCTFSKSIIYAKISIRLSYFKLIILANALGVYFA
jgi:hypothetical protein